MIKRLAALFLVLLLSIESFGAVVSDNDGSAFITKAEFDSLKNNFQSQIDQYNISIDAKIDGAIASYLAGIQVSKKEEKMLKYANWGNVIFLNYAPNNEYALPDFDGSFSQSYLTKISNLGTYKATELFTGSIDVSYIRNTKKNRRNLCDAGDEDGSNMPNTVVWDGISTNLYEKFVGTASYVGWDSHNYNTSGWRPYLWGAVFGSAQFYGCGLTRMKTGYYPTGFDHFNNQTWWPRIYYDTTADPEYKPPTAAGYLDMITNSSSKATFNVSMEINLKDDNAGNKRDYVHIIEWNKKTFPLMTDIDWSHSLRTLDGYKFQDLKDNASISSRLLWIERPYGDSLHDLRVPTTVQNANGYYSYLYNNTDDQYIPGVGVINKTYTSESILQTKNADEYDLGKNEKIIAPKALNLYEGFGLFAASEGSEIEWEPVFNGSKVNGIRQDFELKMMFAMEPFGEGKNVSQNKIIRVNGALDDFVTTINGRRKVKFTMPDKGIVYFKAWPSDDSLLLENWETSLDLSECEYYYETKES